MRELIDRAALIAEYDRVHIGEPGGARKLIEEAPTIEERKTGKWLWKMLDVYRCSVCETETHVDECMEEPIYNFCPFCGADMRGKQE